MMMESICTIPVTEVLADKEGCPLCRMRRTLEKRVVEYITGPAMMEPDVRLRTNELGFCRPHLDRMLAARQRLPVALTLETHLAEVHKRVFGEGKPAFLRPAGKKRLYETARLRETCFVCDRMEWGMSRLVDNLLDLYDREPEIRRSLEAQSHLCLPDYALLLEKGEQKLSKRTKGEFRQTVDRLAEDYLSALREDVRHFCDMFDYRNSGENADWGNARDSLERTAAWLSGDE